ncbi:MAG TPA: O-antigen ligase family protein [Solirubrobacterales bacterium]|nr:O-antigen ligase family protein [Solirubrobacterales bacterium]
MSTVRGLPAGVLGRRTPALRWSGAPDLPTWAWYGIMVAIAVLMGIFAGINPKYAIAGAFGLAFVMLVLVDLTFGLCAFTFLSFLELLLVSEDRSFSFLKVAGFLLLASWVASVSTSREEDKSFIASHPQFTFVLIAFLSWATISSYWAEAPGRAYDTSWRYLQNMILFLIVYTAIRHRNHVKWLLWSWVGGATFATVPAIMNPPQAEADLTTRISGTIGDPNELAALLVAGTAFAIALSVTSKDNPLARLAAMGAAGLFLFGIFYTVSRGGLVALAVAIVAACLMSGRYRVQATLVGVVTALFVVLYFASFANVDQRDRVTTIEGGSGRSDIWKVGWRMVEDKPVIGVGSGNFNVSSIHYLLVSPGAIERDEFIVDTPKVAHNSYLQVLAELGMVGLALFLWIIGFAIWCALRAARWFGRAGDNQMEIVARAMVVALVGILAADFFITEQYGKQLWLLLGLGPALLGVARRTYPGAKDEPKPTRRLRLI